LGPELTVRAVNGENLFGGLEGRRT
jgi:hypothetical protein